MKPVRKPNAAGAAGRAPLLLTVAGLFFYAWFCVVSLNKPLVTDEADLAAAGLAIAETGKPIYYMGDVPEQYVPVYGRWVAKSTPYPDFQWGLWHSPLYVYCIGLSYKIFGTANWAGRLPGAVLFLIEWALLCHMARMLFPPDKGRLVCGVFTFLYFTNPLVLQEGLQIDGDGTVVPATSLFFLHEFIRLEKKGQGRLIKFIWLGVALAITYWAKEFAGLYLATALLIYYTLRRQWLDCAGAAAMFIGGTALFWGTWWLFCALGHMPFYYFLHFTGGKLAQGEGVIFPILQTYGILPALLTICWSILFIAVWASPFYLALALIAAGWRLRLMWKMGKPELFDSLLIYAIVVFGAAEVFRPSGAVVRYADPMYWIMLLIIAAFACEAGIGAKPWQWLTAVFLALGVAIAQALLFGDPLLMVYGQGIGALCDTFFWWFFIVSAIALFAVSPILWPKAKLPGLVTASFLIGLAGFSFGQNWEQSRPYITTSNGPCYGEVDHDEMAAYLASVLKPDEMPICRKDFGGWENRKFGAPLRRWYDEDVINSDSIATQEEFVRNITAPNVQHILLGGYPLQPKALAVIKQYYVLDRQIGSFYLLRRTKLPMTQ